MQTVQHLIDLLSAMPRHYIVEHVSIDKEGNVKATDVLVKQFVSDYGSQATVALLSAEAAA